MLSEISAAYWTMGRHWSSHLSVTSSVSTLKALFQELYESTFALGLAVTKLRLLVLELEQENSYALSSSTIGWVSRRYARSTYCLAQTLFLIEVDTCIESYGS